MDWLLYAPQYHAIMGVIGLAVLYCVIRLNLKDLRHEGSMGKLKSFGLKILRAIFFLPAAFAGVQQTESSAVPPANNDDK